MRGLTSVTAVLVKQRDALKETLDTAPLALNNLYLAYNEDSGTLDQRTNIGENVNALIDDPALVLCAIVEQAGNPASACEPIKRLLADRVRRWAERPSMPASTTGRARSRSSTSTRRWAACSVVASDAPRPRRPPSRPCAPPPLRAVTCSAVQPAAARRCRRR